MFWDAERATGEEIGWAEFYTAGHHQPDGSDVRVTSEAGRPIPFRVIMIGPGDLLRLVFQLNKGERKYAVYFGQTDDMPAPRRLPDDAPVRGGLLLEMRQFPGGAIENFQDIEGIWQRGQTQTLIGRTMMERPFVGFNPFGEQQQTASRYVGSLFAPLDGEYVFAAAADDRGAIYIDGKPLLFIPGFVGDVRFNAKISLTRGRHDFVLHHINGGGEGRFSVAWKPPGSPAFEVIPRESFGISPRAIPAPLEELRKSLTADFSTEYLGECFYDNHYSHRLRLSANAPKSNVNFTCEWDFGDGQSSREKAPEHVFLSDGVYPVRLTVKIGGNSDTQVSKINITRDYAHIDRPPEDQFETQSKIVASYDVKTLPLSWLTWALYVHTRAKNTDAALAVARRLCAEQSIPEPEPAIRALLEISRAAFAENKSQAMLDAWATIPQSSNLQPKAVRYHVQFLVWWGGDFAAAVKTLEPFVETERDDGGEPVANEPGLRDAQRLRRLFGQAMILSGKPAEGRKILEGLGSQSLANRQVVISGAYARSIEHYISEGDFESGEEVWERWQARYPSDFLEGYSVLLRVKLIELRKSPEVAARVAEAFASHVPDSSYAPSLLHKAMTLTAKSDPQRSQALRDRLKKRYPEDPLAQ